LTENAIPKNGGPMIKGWQVQWRKRKGKNVMAKNVRLENAGLESVGLANDGPHTGDGKCRTKI